MYRFQEGAVKAIGITEKFFWDTLVSMEDPLFLIDGKWYSPARKFRSLVQIDNRGMSCGVDILASQERRPTAVRDGIKGKIIQLTSKHFTS